MFLSREQVEKLYATFQKDEGLNLVEIKDEPNGSGIGPDTFAQFYRDGMNPWKRATKAEIVNITDVALW